VRSGLSGSTRETHRMGHTTKRTPLAPFFATRLSPVTSRQFLQARPLAIRKSPLAISCSLPTRLPDDGSTSRRERKMTDLWVVPNGYATRTKNFFCGSLTRLARRVSRRLCRRSEEAEAVGGSGSLRKFPRGLSQFPLSFSPHCLSFFAPSAKSPRNSSRQTRRRTTKEILSSRRVSIRNDP